MKEISWETAHFSFFQNRDCEFFPCHKTEDPDRFNCLFCYCPLYALGEKCSGSFVYTENGVKDCSGCLFPHKRENFGTVAERFSEVAEIARAKQK